MMLVVFIFSQKFAMKIREEIKKKDLFKFYFLNTNFSLTILNT